MMNIYAFADEASSIIDEQIIAMKRNKLQGLEIRNVDGTNISDITLEKAKEVKEKLDANGLVTWSLGSPIGKINIITDDFEKHLEKLHHTCKIANVLGAENIRMFSFYYPDDMKPEQVKDKVFDCMKKMLDVAKEYGVYLCHENEKGIYGDVATRCLELYKAFPDLKGVFDPANFVQCGQDTREAFEMLKDYVYYLHIKDARADGNVVPAGEGVGNIPFIIKEYAARGGNAVTLEPHLKVFEGLKNLEKEGEKIQVGITSYASGDEAFDVAVKALRRIL
ncbi:MAG: sugar phosphate isomerase/epimerase [Clostridia bacterium]|nr:sugar phosphate isomerase/epimerase [Clostridia bacterium]